MGDFVGNIDEIGQHFKKTPMFGVNMGMITWIIYHWSNYPPIYTLTPAFMPSAYEQYTVYMFIKKIKVLLKFD